MSRIAHLINPVRNAQGELRDAQLLATRTLVDARQHALERGVPVELLTAQYLEDRWLDAPYRATADLERSVLDFGRFATPRKLPLLADLIGRLLDESGAEILVYSNVDIAVQRDFYVGIAELMATIDACSITRRTVPPERALDADATTIASIARSVGLPHPGHDCFVVRRSLLERLELGRMCIGFPPFGRALVAILSSLVARPERFAILDAQLTFHVGDAKSWQRDEYHDYWIFNRAEALAAIDRSTTTSGLSALGTEIRGSIASQDHL